jgi:hypothetical protein
MTPWMFLAVAYEDLYANYVHQTVYINGEEVATVFHEPPPIQSDRTASSIVIGSLDFRSLFITGFVSEIIVLQGYITSWNLEYYMKSGCGDTVCDIDDKAFTDLTHDTYNAETGSVAQCTKC